MSAVVVGLLVSLLVVLGLMLAFFSVYRRERRKVVREAPRPGPLLPVNAAWRRPVPFLLPPRWLAIRSSNTVVVRDSIGGDSAASLPWSEAMARLRERKVFISPPVDGWTLVIGAGLPDPAVDVDVVYRFLTRLSRSIGEVHFYSADRVLNLHSWARLDSGRVTRAYAWAGETLWNEGRPTLEERMLGMRCRAYAEEPPPMRFGEVPSELHNTERVVLLARRWSVDPMAAIEILLQQEAVGSEEDESPEG